MSIKTSLAGSLAVLALALGIGGPAAAEDANTPSVKQLYEIIQKQQHEIEALRERLDAQEGRVDQTNREVARTRQAVEATADAVETRMSSGAKASSTHVGGYGELHANFLDRNGPGDDLNELDFHRFVLFFGHDFNERTRFYSELELEHAFSEATEVETEDGLVEEVERTPGELELEQAFVEFDLNDRLTARGGVFLLPLGILNDTHEPPTFYGVERNPVEHDIIPSTWWEGGAGLSGDLGRGFSFDLALTSGLATDAEHGYTPREGRQKAAEAAFDNPAATGRVKYTGIPGLELAASIQYQDDITQGEDPSAGGATLFETHADWRRGPFGLRALYARWDLDGAGPRAVGADRQDGFYIEPSWRFSEQWGVFTRFNQWDNAAGDGLDSRFRQWNLGVNYWPVPNVVFKADYQTQDAPDGSDEFDGINLGIGYMF